jgi:hypothetical protein
VLALLPGCMTSSANTDTKTFEFGCGGATKSAHRSLFCTVMVFCGMLVAFLFFSSFRTSFGLLLLCGCYFWIVHTAFNSSLRNVRALEMQIHMIRQSRIDPATTPVPARVAMFYKFRWYMSLCVFCDLIITIVITMVMVRMLWLDVALHQAIDLLFFVGVGWTFRMVSRRTSGPLLLQTAQFNICLLVFSECCA